MVPADSRRISRVPRYSGVRYATGDFAYGAITRYGPTFQTVPLDSQRAISRPYYPGPAETGPVWAPPRSLATTKGITFVFSSCGY